MLNSELLLILHSMKKIRILKPIHLCSKALNFIIPMEVSAQLRDLLSLELLATNTD